MEGAAGGVAPGRRRRPGVAAHRCRFHRIGMRSRGWHKQQPARSGVAFAPCGAARL